MDIHRLVESEADELEVANGNLPWGYHYEDPTPGRDPSVVETDYEVELWHHEQLELGVSRPYYTCAYCADSFRSSSLQNALRWWHAHDCLTLEQRERLALIYDIGGALPPGHPFAPEVDGKRAA